MKYRVFWLEDKNYAVIVDDFDREIARCRGAGQAQGIAQALELWDSVASVVKKRLPDVERKKAKQEEE